MSEFTENLKDAVEASLIAGAIGNTIAPGIGGHIGRITGFIGSLISNSDIF